MIEAQKIVGSWNLDSFVIRKGDSSTEWQGGSHGILIYSEDGYMSVSINANIFESIDRSSLYYAGS